GPPAGRGRGDVSRRRPARGGWRQRRRPAAGLASALEGIPRHRGCGCPRRARLGGNPSRLRAGVFHGSALARTDRPSPCRAPGRGGADPAGSACLRHARAVVASAAMKGPKTTAGRWTVFAAAGLVLLLVAAIAFAVGGVSLSIPDLLSGEGPAGERARLLAALRWPRVVLAA